MFEKAFLQLQLTVREVSNIC